MSRPPRRRYQYNWRNGNRFELLIDGPAFLPRMLTDIATARHYVLLELYWIESGTVADRFIEALIHAAGRGVVVRALFDDFGAMQLTRFDRDRLRHGGVELVFYNPFSLKKIFDNLARDHRKLLIVDGGVAYTGGAGLSDAFDPREAATPAWRETMVRMQGPVVADWQHEFDWLWRRVVRFSDAVAPLEEGIDSLPVEEMKGRVTVIRGPATQEIKRSLLKQLRQAKRRVWFTTAYFIPSWRIRRALRRAVRRGIDVRLLLPGPNTDHPAVRYAGRRFYHRLLANGVRIFEYQPRVLHHKVALCDQWATLGSCNFDRWNLRWNLEANQEVDDQEFAAAVEAMFEADFASSKEILDRDWRNRSLGSRLAESWWGRVDLWLIRLGQRVGDQD